MEKRKIILLVVLAVLIVTIGITFAYFIAQTGIGAKSNLNVTADSVDDLKFSVSKENLSLSANQFNFTQGSGNLSDSVTAIASLKANSTKSTATYNYHVYLAVDGNNYSYTTTDKKPEIVLSITGPNGEITSIKGLNYVSASDASGTVIKGFDITEFRTELLTITDNQEITSSSSLNYTNQEWNFKLTFINLDSDQTDNEGKVLSAKVIIQKDKLIDNILEVAKSGDTLVSAIETLGVKGVSASTKLFYHDNTLVNGAEDNSYRFAGGNPHEDYYSCSYNGIVVANYVGGATNNILKGNCSNVYKIDSEEGPFYFDKSFELYNYNTFSVKWNSTSGVCEASDGMQVLDYDGYPISEESKCSGIVYQYLDTDFYFVGVTSLGAGVETLTKNASNGVNNYVCFGTDNDDCSNDNLYRIVGLIDGKIKLILADGATTSMLGTDGGYVGLYNDVMSRYAESYAGNGTITEIGSYMWNKDGVNTWSSSSTYTNNLNTNFLSYLDGKGTKWKTMIDDTLWYVGGMGEIEGARSNAKTSYGYELGINKNTSTTVTAKIGLMYVTEYYFAALPNYWTLPGYNKEGMDYRLSDNDNWMFASLYEFTISPSTNRTYNVFSMLRNVGGNRVNIAEGRALRPTFNLVSTVKYLSGTGTYDDPIRIGI